MAKKKKGGCVIKGQLRERASCIASRGANFCCRRYVKIVADLGTATSNAGLDFPNVDALLFTIASEHRERNL